jgi:hypothetical protein
MNGYIGANPAINIMLFAHGSQNDVISTDESFAAPFSTQQSTKVTSKDSNAKAVTNIGVHCD